MNFKNISISLVVFLLAIFLQSNKNQLQGNHSKDPTYYRKFNRIKLGMPKSDKPDEATRWFCEQRAFPGKQIPFDWKEKALAHIKKNNLMKSLKTTLSWNSVGPHNVGGRVRAIAISNTNPNIIYAGSVSGGIFKSIDGGSSWIPTSDQATNLAISSIVVDPTDNNIVYAGTGEGFFNYDAVRGQGILKSTDAGVNWTLLQNFSGSTGFPYYINDLYLRPDSVNILYAASNSGIFRTTNSGISWSLIHQGISPCRATQITPDPTAPLIFYVCYGNHYQDGIYKTTNGGTSFTKLTTGLPTSGFNRIALAVSKSNPSIIYASLDSASTHYTHSIQKSTDGGTSWFAVGKPIDTQLGGSHLGGQGWYNNVIAVHPTDPNIVFAAGINLYKSTNGGTNWSMIGYGYTSPPQYIHVDHHEIVFHPTNSSIIYFGDDGGIFKTTNGGSSFVEINNGFATIQFYSGAIHPTQEIYFGGTQDNGTLKSNTVPNWSMVFGGDGGATAVDYNNPNNVYTEYVDLCIQKSTDGGVNWVKSITGIPAGSGTYDGTTDRVLFIAPFVMDPTTPTMLVAGTYKIYRTTNGGNLWTSISSDLTGDGAGSTGGKISAIAIAKNSSATIFVGTSGGGASQTRVLVTTNTGTTWSIVNKSPLPNRYVTSIAIDRADANNVFVSFSGYDVNTSVTPGHIFNSTNMGSTWLDISGDLPDIPVNAILIDSTSLSHILIGTDLGVFETQNGGISWEQQNTGMANVVVTDLDFRSDGYVFAATHGRGMFKLTSRFGIVIPSDTIYPGDVNDDGIVDSRDLLPIARFYGNQGSARINPSLNWIPQNLNGPFSPIEAAYADCNGNGTVEKTDVLGLIQNWYRTVGSLGSEQVNQLGACEELLKSFGEESSSGIMRDLRSEIIKYRSQLLGVPNEWILMQNYPNPFNPSTTIRFNTPVELSTVRLEIYNITGEVIKEYSRQNVLPGYSTFVWDGTDNEGSRVATGIYFYRLEAGSTQLTDKMVLIK
jgi:photosystem II stability/assembly factor-like uncharacterized protein